MAFAIRNVPDVPRALQEMYRIMKPGGTACILEFSIPTNLLVKRLYLFYFRRIIPVFGGLISGDRAAYQYLNVSVEAFPYGQEFAELMKKAGFSEVTVISMTFGIASLYTGKR
jgi:demethylmenaquinone methyltransferase/2-methoxy-6-polyprenyl-1,4-benzoquinol methylase